MFTFNGRDAHRTLAALKVHLPFHRPIGDILPERHKTEDDEAEPALQRLPAPGLRGTWARAYGLLTRLVSQIGWDELLKTRSAVFVMEEEYRMQKAQTEMQQTLKSAGSVLPPNGESDVGRAVIHEDGTIVRSSDDDDNISTRGVLAPPTPKLGPNEANGIPEIRISTESEAPSDDVSEMTKVDETTGAVEKKDKGKGRAKEEPDEEEEEESDGTSEPNGVHGHMLEKPVQAAAAAEGDKNVNENSNSPAPEAFSFSNKRLCERWLDNLFMVLYEVSIDQFVGHFNLTPSIRTFASGPSSVLRLPTLKRSTLLIGRPASNGKF